MVKLYEEINFKSERDNSYLPSTFHLFLPLMKKSRYKNILIRTDNTAVIYNINKNSGAKNLYHTARKIWKLLERNSLTLKAVDIPGRINVMMDRLSRLEMSGDYHLDDKVFQRIQRMWRCYPKVDLFASKKNRLVRMYVSVIPRKDLDNIGNALRLNWSNIKGLVLLYPLIPLLLKVLKKFQEEGKIAILIAPSWKGQVWTDLLKKLTISTIPLI
jgi:hypothetical protein